MGISKSSPSDKAFAHTDGGNAFGAFDRVAFVDGAGFGQHDDTDIVFFEVLDNALFTGSELDKFAGLRIVKAIDTGNAVAYGENSTDLFEGNVEVDVGQLFFQNRRYFGRFNF